LYEQRSRSISSTAMVGFPAVLQHQRDAVVEREAEPEVQPVECPDRRRHPDDVVRTHVQHRPDLPRAEVRRLSVCMTAFGCASVPEVKSTSETRAASARGRVESGARSASHLPNVFAIVRWIGDRDVAHVAAEAACEHCRLSPE
jgi:hypothetical protein